MQLCVLTHCATLAGSATGNVLGGGPSLGLLFPAVTTVTTLFVILTSVPSVLLTLDRSWVASVFSISDSTLFLVSLSFSAITGHALLPNLFPLPFLDTLIVHAVSPVLPGALLLLRPPVLLLPLLLLQLLVIALVLVLLLCCHCCYCCY